MACFCFSRKPFRHRGPEEPPEDVKNVFNLYAKTGTMTVDGLLRFLIEYQGESTATKDDAQAVFNSLRHLNIFQTRGLHIDAFFRYLLGDLNGPLSSKVHHDMNAPLAHYFVFTSHSSYLTGNQLTSNISVQPIINALLRGARAIELDLWPDSKNTGVEVRHLWSLTRPVKLSRCLNAIKDYAFSNSAYPVIITFEDHLTADLQASVAKMVIETFGDMLYWPPSEPLKEFPSPESLKGKILISTKPQEYHEDDQRPKESRFTDHEDSEDDDQDEDDLQNAAPEFKQLIAIYTGKRSSTGLDVWHVDPAKVRRLTLNKQELENAARTRGTDIVRFSHRNLLRVYPKGTFLDLSNYDPMLGWMHGAQMVAFNMQGYGKYLWIMEGMFRSNGGCGYVKKPDFLLTVGPNDEVFDPHQSLPVKKNLKVKVCMGDGWRSDFHHTRFDLYSPADFSVRVGIAGVPKDTQVKETKVIEDQWTPVWNQEFNFLLCVPELAVLRVEVIENDSSGMKEFGGQTCLPIPELRTGIRAVPLLGRRGQQYKSVKLLMIFEFNSIE